MLWVFPSLCLTYGIAKVVHRPALSVNNRLRELREARGWSQGELAEQLEVSRQTVNALETGKYDPSLPLAFKLARMFGQSIEDIFLDEPAEAAMNQTTAHPTPHGTDGMSRKIRLIVAAVVLLSLLGYRQFAHREREAATPRREGRIERRRQPARRRPSPAASAALAFTPCTLATETRHGNRRGPVQPVAGAGKPRRAERPQDRLAIAWLPAKGERQPDPVFMLAGGPGQSALEVLSADRARLRRSAQEARHHPGRPARHRRLQQLICKDARGKSAVVEDDDYGVAAARGFRRGAAPRTCRRRPTCASTRTTDAIQDLDDVREAIGAEQINLMGVSYGTRVAQQYAKRYPRSTRTRDHRSARAQHADPRQRIRAATSRARSTCSSARCAQRHSPARRSWATRASGSMR